MASPTDLAAAQVCPADAEVSNAGGSHFLELYEEATIFRVVHGRFEEVEIPFLLASMLLVLVCARVLFHNFNLNQYIPDSVLTIIIGMIVGGYLTSVDAPSDAAEFDDHIFFVFVLPWIILRDGYFTDVRAFIANLNVILLLAFAGTIFNAVAIAGVLYGLADPVGIANFRFVDGLVFGSLIAAVDPVAVLPIFAEAHVNDNLYITVLGQSCINDSVTVVLFRIFAALAVRTAAPAIDVNTGTSVAIAFGQFAIVAAGGLVIGLLFGLAAAFIVMFMRQVSGLAPIVVVGLGYMAYLLAESFEISGIIAALSAGMTMQLYVSGNLSRDASTGVQTVLHVAADVAESYVFVVLGIELVRSVDNGWNTGFVFVALAACFVARFISVYGVVAMVNPYRHGEARYSKGDSFLLFYGGLRGAIAFALASILLHDEQLCTDGDVPFTPFRFRELFVSTAIAIVVFTIVVQGPTVRPLLELLHVRHKDESTNPKPNKLAYEIVDTAAAHTVNFAHALAGTNPHNALSWAVRCSHAKLKRFFYHENRFRMRHAFEVLEDDIEATARRLVESVRDAQKSIAQRENLSDAEKVAKLADHVQDALHNAAGGVTSRLRNAQEQGALDDAWQQYDATTARPTRPRKQAYHRGVTHDNAEDGPQQLHQTARRASIEAPPDSLNQGSRSDRKAASDDHRALSSKQMSQSARASNSLTSHSDDQRSRLSMSSAAFHRAIQSRHPDKKPDAMRSHKTKPFAMHHHQHRQNHDEHHHHWQYLVHRHTRRGDFKRKRPAEADDRKSSSQGRPVDDREPKAQGRSTDENVKARSPADSRSNGSREAFSPAELETVQTHSNHEPKDNSKIVTLV
eukprot:TRINITY_DN8400_c0_g1_i2.p1 TRINITY_DN8400_c0_g1~~TRINITY_DN8400_c0_g1_i2.p1  ORF type:complete len:853 (+),score=183.31 TRINITY_DN8400_c0_g1_i2:115-2673(+)